jgi:putative membrane protein
MMFWYGNGMSGWGYAFTLLVWALVIAGVVVVVRYLAHEPPTPKDTTPERILAERFARGEISEQEYQSRLATLHRGPRPAGHP